ncbi:hypothetical protein K466DRAFT_272534 [Polyporus arcularius HHB13444]|uniref:Uncharacterized protein n=1 Tax=Polyporus arcularius HHB13444 TaxID=1314778 RepID=A0A5C3P3F9_9APHY|nr:hypothetical protein K466DRAFT_272534 [Polyporus arcularius HHB13444]
MDPARASLDPCPQYERRAGTGSAAESRVTNGQTRRVRKDPRLSVDMDPARASQDPCPQYERHAETGSAAESRGPRDCRHGSSDALAGSMTTVEVLGWVP